MRWRKQYCKRGDTRTICKFLWLPTTIKGETRWLESVTIKQTYYIEGCLDTVFKGWENDAFK